MLIDVLFIFFSEVLLNVIHVQYEKIHVVNLSFSVRVDIYAFVAGRFVCLFFLLPDVSLLILGICCNMWMLFMVVSCGN